MSEKKLTEEELKQVSGGRRTDDPEQSAAKGCIAIALGDVSNSVTLPKNVKSELIDSLNYVFDCLSPWHLANPNELIPIINEIITKLEPYKNQESFSWVLGKLNAAIEHLNNLED